MPWYVEALLLVVLGALVLQTLAVAYPAGGGSPNRDSGIFLYAGSRILQGEIPYKNVWDHKPPAVPYIDALGLLIGRGSAWGVWLLEALAVVSAALLSYVLMRRLFGPLVAALASMASTALLPVLVGNGNFTEEYALPLQWLALWLFFHAEWRGRYSWEGYAIGVAGALAFLLRQNLVGVWLAIGLCLVLRAAWRRDWRELQPLGPITTAGTGTVLAVLAYFAARGALADLWDVAFRSNFAYSQPALSGLWQSALTGLGLLLGLVAPALVGWMVGLRRMLGQRHGQDAGALVAAVCILDLPVEIVLSGLSGRVYPHYYVAWLPFCAFLTGSVLAILERNLRACWAEGQGRKGDRLLGRRLVCTGTTVIILPLMLVAQLSILPAGSPWLRAERRPYGDVAQYVQGTTAEGDTILTWGLEGSINFMAGRRSPSRFVYQYPLFSMPGYQSGEMVEEFLAGVEAAKPALIIDTSPTEKMVPPLDAAARQERLQEPHDFVLLPEMDEVFSYVAEHYRPVEMPSPLGWVAYRYVGSEEGSAQTE